MRSVRLVLCTLALTALPAAGQDAAAHSEGRAIFEMVCAMCHSVEPPAKAAPPMSHAAAYYLRKHEVADSAAAALVAYLKAPSPETSVLPAHAIERFGLMPAQAHLSDQQLDAVARYVLTLADTEHGSGMQHREGMQHGAGMQHNGGVQPDTVAHPGGAAGH